MEVEIRLTHASPEIPTAHDKFGVILKIQTLNKYNSH